MPPPSRCRRARGTPPTPRHSTARFSDSNCSYEPAPPLRRGGRPPAASVRRRNGCRAGRSSGGSRGEVGVDHLHPFLVWTGGVELVFEAVDHVRGHVGGVHVELLVPPAKLVDGAVLLTQQ